MVKGKLERKYKLIYNGRELSKGLLSEAGKYDAMQILVQRFDEGREVQSIQMRLRSSICHSRRINSNGSIDWSGVFLRPRILFLSYVQLF